MSGDEEPVDLETHPLNPAAVRRPGGYWNEGVLPVTDWESPEHRVVLPWHLQQRLGPEVPPVLRWARRKYLAVIGKHERDHQVIGRISSYLDGWRFIGADDSQRIWRVLFQDETDRWYAATIGVDALGATISSPSSADPTGGFWQIDCVDWRSLQGMKSDPRSGRQTGRL
jgi:hypothetical protein